MSIVQVESFYDGPSGISKERQEATIPSFYFIDPYRILDPTPHDKIYKHVTDLSHLPADAAQTYQILDQNVFLLKGNPAFHKLVEEHQMVGLGFGEFRQIFPQGPFMIDSPEEINHLTDNVLILAVTKKPTGLFPFPWINMSFYQQTKPSLERDIRLDNEEEKWKTVKFRKTHLNPKIGRVIVTDLRSTHYNRRLAVLLTYEPSSAFELTDRASQTLSYYADLLLRNPEWCDEEVYDRSIDDI